MKTNSLDKGLIPVAIARAKLVNPDESIKDDWEEAIYRDLATHDPRFSWYSFLSNLIP